jgi:hypothetical protein
MFLISNFRRVVNNVFVLLGVSPDAGETPKRTNTYSYVVIQKLAFQSTCVGHIVFMQKLQYFKFFI